MKGLAARIFSERRAFVLPLVALAFVNVALYAFAVYPLGLRVRTLERRALTSRDQLAAAEKEYAAAKALVTGRQRADAELKTFYEQVLPQDLAGARRMTYARLAQIARNANLKYVRRAYQPDDSYEGDLQKLTIVMDLSGDYDDVRTFLHEVETSPEFVVIEKMVLQERSDSDPELTLTLNLATFYRTTPHGD